MATYEYLSYGADDGTIVNRSSEALGFYGTTPVAKQTISGSVSSGAGVSSIAVALAAMGLCTNSLTT